MNEFVEELPETLRLQASLYIYEDRYANIRFLANKEVEFIAWLCPRMKTTQVRAGEMIYRDDERIKSVYFLTSGSAAYVIGNFNNTPYISVSSGSSLGITDIIGSSQKHGGVISDMSDPQQWYLLKHKLLHLNTIMAVETCELQAIELSTLVEMASVYYDEYIGLFEEKINLLRRTTILKLDAIKVCTD